MPDDLMPKMAASREDHRQAMSIAGGDDLVITARAARLNDGRDARVGSAMDRIVKRKKRVGGERRAA